MIPKNIHNSVFSSDKKIALFNPFDIFFQHIHRQKCLGKILQRFVPIYFYRDWLKMQMEICTRTKNANI